MNRRDLASVRRWMRTGGLSRASAERLLVRCRWLEARAPKMTVPERLRAGQRLQALVRQLVWGEP